LLAEPSPLNIDLGSDPFSMFNKKRDIRIGSLYVIIRAIAVCPSGRQQSSVKNLKAIEWAG